MLVSHMTAFSLGRFAGWTTAKTSRRALSCLAGMCCALGLAGSAFDYSVVRVAAFSDDATSRGIGLLGWNGVLGNVLLGSLGLALAAALVLALSLWMAPREAVKAAPRRRQLCDAAD